MGPDRTPGESTSRIKRRIPRNAPALWNLGAKEITNLFHDGRLSLSDDYNTGFNSPAEERLPAGLSGLLAAQAVFPLAARFEMAGDPEENSVARATFDRTHDPIPRDTGRMAESDRLEDNYRFRTPSLRNVEVTGPYGHNGAYNSLKKIVMHHLDPIAFYRDWHRPDATLPDVSWLNDTDLILLQDKREITRYFSKSDPQKQTLSETQVDAIINFLHALTGYSVKNTPLGVPANVPSGIPVDQ